VYIQTGVSSGALFSKLALFVREETANCLAFITVSAGTTRMPEGALLSVFAVGPELALCWHLGVATNALVVGALQTIQTWLLSALRMLSIALGLGALLAKTTLLGGMVVLTV
jgi:hypothetical protein